MDTLSFRHIKNLRLGRTWSNTHTPKHMYRHSHMNDQCKWWWWREKKTTLNRIAVDALPFPFHLLSKSNKQQQRKPHTHTRTQKRWNGFMLYCVCVCVSFIFLIHLHHHLLLLLLGLLSVPAFGLVWMCLFWSCASKWICFLEFNFESCSCAPSQFCVRADDSFCYFIH